MTTIAATACLLQIAVKITAHVLSVLAFEDWLCSDVAIVFL